MSQPVQIYQSGFPVSGLYSVIDNSAAGNLLGVAGGSGYDTTYPGAIAQGSNSFTNGTIPDCVNRATVEINNPSLAPGTRVLFLNPA